MSQDRTLESLYSQLPSSEPSFRLLRVLPSVVSFSRIRCQLVTASVKASANRYIAGSYVWGAPDQLATVFVNGVEISVRENLVHFLRACRHRRKEAIMWIDAVCINQEDPAERSSQVAMMDRIYTNAQAVYCWLGASEGVADALNECNAAIARPLNQNFLSEFTSNMEKVVHCEYWTRIWIVQEFILAQEVFLLSGPVKVPLECVSRLLSLMAFHDSVASQIFQFRHAQKEGLRFHRFEQLFGMFCSLGCAISRDRVFALIGILRKEEAALLKPLIDYEISIERLLSGILDNGLIRDYPRFMWHFSASVLHGGAQTDVTLENVDVPLPLCDRITVNPDAKEHSCQIYQYLGDQPDEWSHGLSVAPQSSRHLDRSYNLLRILNSSRTDISRYVCVLVEVCTKECTRQCQGHAFAGAAMRSRGLSSWEAAAVQTKVDAEEFRSKIFWEGNYHTAVHLLQRFNLSVIITCVSNAEYRLKTDLETFMELCDILGQYLDIWSETWGFHDGIEIQVAPLAAR